MEWIFYTGRYVYIELILKSLEVILRWPVHMLVSLGGDDRKSSWALWWILHGGKFYLSRPICSLCPPTLTFENLIFLLTQPITLSFLPLPLPQFLP